MASIVPGSLVGDIRGSVGTETYARNRGGLYVRTRAGPAGPPNPNQIAITNAMTALSQAWSTTLTETQRQSWIQYARQFPRPNRWGEPTNTTGYNRFIAVNFPEQVRTLGLFRTTAPTAPPLPAPVFSFSAAWDDEQILIDTPFVPALPNDSSFRAYFYTGADVPIGVNFYASPWQYRDTNTKINGVWTTDPWLIDDVIFTRFTASHRWGRMRIQNTVTGSISTPGFYVTTTTEEL